MNIDIIDIYTVLRASLGMILHRLLRLLHLKPPIGVSIEVAKIVGSALLHWLLGTPKPVFLAVKLISQLDAQL